MTAKWHRFRSCQWRVMADSAKLAIAYSGSVGIRQVSTRSRRSRTSAYRYPFASRSPLMASDQTPRFSARASFSASITCCENRWYSSSEINLLSRCSCGVSARPFSNSFLANASSGFFIISVRWSSLSTERQVTWGKTLLGVTRSYGAERDNPRNRCHYPGPSLSCSSRQFHRSLSLRTGTNRFVCKDYLKQMWQLGVSFVYPSASFRRFLKSTKRWTAFE
jgi:hypothetical protein